MFEGVVFVEEFRLVLVAEGMRVLVAVDDDGRIIVRVLMDRGFLAAAHRALLQTDQIIVLLVQLAVHKVERYPRDERQYSHPVMGTHTPTKPSLSFVSLCINQKTCPDHPKIKRIRII